MSRRYLFLSDRDKSGFARRKAGKNVAKAARRALSQSPKPLVFKHSSHRPYPRLGSNPTHGRIGPMTNLAIYR